MEAQNGPAKDLRSQALYRFIAECVIFNIGSLATFYPRLDRLGEVVDWDSLEVYFRQDPKFLKSSYSSSPFLGGRRDVYRLMFAISWLSQCRTEDLAASHHNYIHILNHEILRLQNSLENYYANDVPVSVRTLYTIKYQLHVFAMQIYSLKIARQGICSAHKEVAALVSQSLSLLLTGKLDEVYNPSLCWPLTILLCAAHHDVDFDSLTARTAIYQTMLGAGHASRMGKVISRLKDRRAMSSSPCSAEIDPALDCDGKHDGLSLLLQRGGLT